MRFFGVELFDFFWRGVNISKCVRHGVSGQDEIEIWKSIK